MDKKGMFIFGKFVYVCICCCHYTSALVVPSFSVASERCLGSWVGAFTLSSPSLSPSPSIWKVTSVEVEEVMRSCGGTVQGFEEIRKNSDDNEAPVSMYMNRADEKFTFFDCGSYCVGPVKRELDCTEKYLFVLSELQDNSARSVFQFEMNNGELDHVLYSYEVRTWCEDRSKVEHLLMGKGEQNDNYEEVDDSSSDVDGIIDFQSFMMPPGSNEAWNPMKLKFSTSSSSLSDDIEANAHADNVDKYITPDGERSIVVDKNSRNIECRVPGASLGRKYDDKGILSQVTLMRQRLTQVG